MIKENLGIRKSEIINRRIGKERGTFSNLKIKNSKLTTNNVVIIRLLIIEKISCKDAYLQIPRYRPKNFNREMLLNAKKME